MLSDSYIKEREQEIVQKDYCDRIVKYSKVRKAMYQWYEVFGLRFPHTSENNFRDAWFHYRKLYREHSTYEVISQIATLEEHIQRAEKDSIVFFFQKISELLEVWYFVATERIVLKPAEGYIKDAVDIYESAIAVPNSWVSILRERCGEDISAFTASCLCIFQQRILSKEFAVDVQVLLHEMKNKVFELRMGGVSIMRINQPGEYYEAFEPYYENLLSFCDKYRMIELLGVTDIMEKMMLK
jgi:hypothetical protein